MTISIHVLGVPNVSKTVNVIRKNALHYHVIFVGFLRGGCSRGGGNWGTLRIPQKDWGTLGNIGED